MVSSVVLPRDYFDKLGDLGRHGGFVPRDVKGKHIRLFKKI